MNTFSLFDKGIRNTFPTKGINLIDFVELLKQDNKLVELIRFEKDKKKRDKLKSNLSYVTFGGEFQKRSNKNLIKSSGLACFDLDELPNLEELRQRIIKDEFTNLLFVSPSGNGLKLIVKIPEVKNDEEYKKYWKAISKYFNLPSTDESCKDIARACYLSVDKNPYFNADSKIFTQTYEEEIIDIPSYQNEKSYPRKEGMNESSEFLERLKSSISMTEILNHFGVDTSMNPTNCPFHSCSQRCLSFNDEVCNCFDTDCGRGYNIFSFVKKIKGLNSADTIKWLSEFAGMQKEYEESKQNFIFFNDTRKPLGWANSINIKRMAERKGWTNCPTCNSILNFNEKVGLFRCPLCKTKGNIKDLANLMLAKGNKK